jgi:hypothetical protein
MTRPIDMLEHEMRDRLAAKNAEIARLTAALAAAEERCRHETTVEAGCDWLRCNDCGKFVARSVAERRSTEAALAAAEERVRTLEAWADGPHGVKWYMDALAAAEDVARQAINRSTDATVCEINLKSTLIRAQNAEAALAAAEGSRDAQQVRAIQAEAALAAVEERDRKMIDRAVARGLAWRERAEKAEAALATARADTLEAAAKVADRMDAVGHIAAAIRALKEKTAR